MKILSALAACLAVASPQAAAQCSEWGYGFHAPGANNDVKAWATFDEGAGEALFAGGDFTAVAGIPGTNGVARWTSVGWSSVGGGVAGSVYALAVYDDGSGPRLHAVVRSFMPGGPVEYALFAWDGHAWTAVPGDFDGSIHSLIVFDDGSGSALYAGGYFEDIDGNRITKVAKWDGTSWSGLGAGLDGGGVADMAVYDDGSGPALFAAGRFDTAGGMNVEGIAKWDGSSWSSIVAGAFPWGINAVEAFGSDLYIGGYFPSVGSVTADNLAKWDGINWSAVASGTNAAVSSLAAYDDGSGAALYVGGLFQPSKGAPSTGNHIVRWNGANFAALGTGTDDSVDAIIGFDDGNGPAVFAGGRFSGAGSTVSFGAARWNGTWTQMGSGGDGVAGGGPLPFVRALQSFDDGSGPALFLGGDFEWAGSGPASNVARWNGAAWDAPGGGLPDTVWTLSVFDDGNGEAIYAGGDFDPSHVVRWDGSAWQPVGQGLPNRVLALETFDDGTGSALYAGGSFQMVGGVTARRLAKWDGASWSDPTGGAFPNARVRALQVWDDGSGPQLFVGGDFNAVGGTTAFYVAKWDGTTWTQPGGGFDGRVHGFAVHDDGSGEALYAVGSFVKAGGNNRRYVARWNGTTWDDVGGGVTLAGRSIGVYDQGAGAGPTLLVATNDELAEWDGATWTSEATNGPIRAFASFDDGTSPWPSLFVGGEFYSAGGVLASRFARRTNTCACEGSPYCTAGTTSSGCQAALASTGAASRSAASGFDVTLTGGEGARNGLFFFGTSGPQANPWGNGTSFQCVAPPVRRTGLRTGGGTPGACNGSFSLDFNAWMAAHPQSAPEPSATAYLQGWFRDPANTSSQTTSLSNALSFSVCP